MTLMEDVAKLIESWCLDETPGPWNAEPMPEDGEGEPAMTFWLVNAAGDGLAVDEEDAAVMVNALPLLVDRLAFIKAAHVPTPDELDTLLSDISAAGYASEAREIVENWTRKWWGVESAFTTKWNRP